MDYHPLGKTGLNVGEIGFGAWGIGGLPPEARAGYGPVDDAESLRALEAARDLGANFIDTADAYGAGHSEVVIGKFLPGKRSEVIVATKFGHWPGTERDAAVPSEDNVRYFLEASLRRLGTDYIDVYQWHRCEREAARAHDLAGTMEKLKREGKIRHAGICVYGATQARQAATGQFGPVFETIQESYNVTTLRFREALREAGALGMGIIVREPMGNGLLTGKFKTLAGLEKKDARSLRAPKQAAMRMEFAERLRTFLPRANRTLVQALIRFALQDIPAGVVIPGCKTVAQVEENLGAARAASLTPEEIGRIEAVYRELEQKYGLIHPYAVESQLGLD